MDRRCSGNVLQFLTRKKKQIERDYHWSLVLKLQELRILKNFSSLKAIISALQSNPVYRLHKTWQMVPKEKVKTPSNRNRVGRNTLTICTSESARVFRSKYFKN